MSIFIPFSICATYCTLSHRFHRFFPHSTQISHKRRAKTPPKKGKSLETLEFQGSSLFTHLTRLVEKRDRTADLLNAIVDHTRFSRNSFQEIQQYQRVPFFTHSKDSICSTHIPHGFHTPKGFVFPASTAFSEDVVEENP